MTVSVQSLWRRTPPDPTRRIVVVTDLDGTLLAAETSEAAHVADLLAERAIPLIICSSRTRAEIESLQQNLGLAAPFITENGGALFLPHGYFPTWPDVWRAPAYDVIEFGRPYHAVVEALRVTSRRLGIEVIGFCEMSIDEVAAEYGLTLAEARLAKLREYDEVFRIVDDDPAVHSRLFRALHRAGLRCSSRGRYHHATGVSDKRRSLRTLLSLYRHAAGRILTVGLADSPCDVWVLEEVDIPIVVQNEAIGGWARLLSKVPTARLTSGCGPQGWSEVIGHVIGSPSSSAQTRQHLS
jgi:mannosyl-3-phosphoglycerate phosphatase